jgi:hypothetical protein
VTAAPATCPVCGVAIEPASWDALAAHLVGQAAASDDRHVMWLNRNVTKHATDAGHLALLLEQAHGGAPDDAERVRR